MSVGVAVGTEHLFELVDDQQGMGGAETPCHRQLKSQIVQGKGGVADSGLADLGRRNALPDGGKLGGGNRPS